MIRVKEWLSAVELEQIRREASDGFTRMRECADMMINRGYYMAVRRYEFYLRVLKISHE
mgnify:CR=1 FL=1